MTTPIINNFARKKLRGKFDRTLAIKGILHLVEAGRRKYIKDFGSLGSSVSKETKVKVARGLFQHINEASTFEAKRLRKQVNAKKKLKTVRKRKRQR